MRKLIGFALLGTILLAGAGIFAARNGAETDKTARAQIALQWDEFLNNKTPILVNKHPVKLPVGQMEKLVYVITWNDDHVRLHLLGPEDQVVAEGTINSGMMRKETPAEIIDGDFNARVSILLPRNENLSRR